MTLFDSLFDLTRDGMVFGSGAIRAFLPPTDLIVGDENVVVTMDVPGLNHESLEIELTGDILTIRGERTYPQLDQQNTQWYRIERGYGKFQRTLQVPKGLDPDSVTASLTDGVLTIQVPLPEARKPRRIQIANSDHASIESSTDWEQLEAGGSADSHVEEPTPAGAAV